MNRFYIGIKYFVIRLKNGFQAVLEAKWHKNGIFVDNGYLEPHAL